MTNSNSFAPTFFSGLFAVTASALVLGFAAGPAEARSVEVKVAAAELATPQGRAAVDGRIEQAAEQACGFRPEERDLKTRQTTRLCVAEAIAATDAKIAAIKATSQMASR